MKTKAALIYEAGKPWEIEELELKKPGPNEVLVKYEYAGLCHSDYHIFTGDQPSRLPMVGGHEGAGEVLEVGSAVTRVKPGDKFVVSFIPACGVCRYCATGRQSICDLGATLLEGSLPDGGFPLTGPRGDYGTMCIAGTFAQYGVLHQASVVKIHPWQSTHVASLLACGVPTGYGSAVNAAKVQPGETVAIFGIGGIGINAVQGARIAGAKNIIAVDPVAYKLDKAKEFGATHTFNNAAEAIAAVQEMTWGQMADSSIVTTGVVETETINEAYNIVGKGGTTVITGLSNFVDNNIQLNSTVLTLFRKTVKGSIFGDCNPTYDIPKLLGLYEAGQLKLDELITKEYKLEDINQGYKDMIDGVNLRGVIKHEH